MQGVIKSYDPGSGDGVVLCDTDLAEYDLAADALAHSVFRMLRQGQRVIFDVTADGQRILVNRTVVSPDAPTLSVSN